MNVKLLTKVLFINRGGEQLNELEDETKVDSFIKLPKSVNDYMGDKGQMSVFKVNAKNQLGLDFQKTRAKLLSLALSKPEHYFDLRERVITAITESSVESAYNAYWDLLTQGKHGVGGGQRITWGAGGRGDNFEPHLPESEVNRFALKVANAIKEIAEEAVDEILPMDIDELAKKRSKSILEAKNVKI